MATDIQAKRRSIKGKKIGYRTNNPQIKLEVIREVNGYLALDFSHTKYSGKATITVKIDGLDRKFYRHDLDDRKIHKKGESDAMDYTQRLFRRS
tara:strand:+ start:266 stop:547 length:282 start_codon:yes stop_codon:yes gene_type:complete